MSGTKGDEQKHGNVGTSVSAKGPSVSANGQSINAKAKKAVEVKTKQATAGEKEEESRTIFSEDSDEEVWNKKKRRQRANAARVDMEANKDQDIKANKLHDIQANAARVDIQANKHQDIEANKLQDRAAVSMGTDKLRDGLLSVNTDSDIVQNHPDVNVDSITDISEEWDAVYKSVEEGSFDRRPTHIHTKNGLRSDGHDTTALNNAAALNSDGASGRQRRMLAQSEMQDVYDMYNIKDSAHEVGVSMRKGGTNSADKMNARGKTVKASMDASGVDVDMGTRDGDGSSVAAVNARVKNGKKGAGENFGVDVDMSALDGDGSGVAAVSGRVKTGKKGAGEDIGVWAMGNAAQRLFKYVCLCVCVCACVCYFL